MQARIVCPEGLRAAAKLSQILAIVYTCYRWVMCWQALALEYMTIKGSSAKDNLAIAQDLED